jgi:transposase
MAGAPKNVCAVSREKSAVLTELEGWLRDERARLSRSASVAKAIYYILKALDRFARFSKAQ